VNPHLKEWIPGTPKSDIKSPGWCCNGEGGMEGQAYVVEWAYRPRLFRPSPGQGAKVKPAITRVEQAEHETPRRSSRCRRPPGWSRWIRRPP